MSLLFSWQEIKSRGRALTYDDVLLMPQKSDVRSRRDPDLSTPLTKKIMIQKPFISANMDTITEWEMALSMDRLGCFGIIHRFMTVDEQCHQVSQLKQKGAKHIGASVGVNAEGQERAEALVGAGANIITIDIAHGHSVAMMDTLKWIKDRFPQVAVIAGNVASPQGCSDLIEAGADAIKVGIGPGSMCTTRVITGCGVPQLTAIALCAEVTRAHSVPLIADGGIKTSGDVVKALSAGAQSVMLGSILAGTIETPGEITGGRKRYRGMASREAQNIWRGGVPEGMAPEGESTLVPIKGPIDTVIHELAGGLRSGMSYINAKKVSEMSEKALFLEMTSMGHMESLAHGLRS